MPPTWKRGQSLKLKLSDGREVAVTVPDDVKAGETFKWSMPAPAAKLARSSSWRRRRGCDADVQQAIPATGERMLDDAHDEVKATSDIFQQKKEETAALAVQIAAENEAALVLQRKCGASFHAGVEPSVEPGDDEVRMPQDAQRAFLAEQERIWITTLWVEDEVAKGS